MLFEGNTPKGVLSPERLSKLLTAGKIEFPTITVEEIEDRSRAAHRTVLRLRPYNIRPFLYKICRYPYCKVKLKKLDGTVRVKKRVYGRIYGFLRTHK